MSKKEPLLIKQVGSRTFVDRGDELHPVLQFPITTDRGDMTIQITRNAAITFRNFLFDNLAPTMNLGRSPKEEE
jgi:hypothetical protein